MTLIRVVLGGALCALALGCGSSAGGIDDVAAQRAPLLDGLDPAGNYLGPLAVTERSYQFPAAVHLDVLNHMIDGQPVKTEIWATAWHPTDLSGGPFPMVAMLHGEADTCVEVLFVDGEFVHSPTNSDYSLSGNCDAGLMPAQHHLGYRHMAHRLASFGFIVISINASRGITKLGGPMGDSGNYRSGGRLVLKHLELWHDWNTVGGAPASLTDDPDAFIGAVDFRRVGLMGHSRGGERVRAAAVQYLELGSPWPAAIPNLEIKAIFEIAGSDHPGPNELTAHDIAWHAIIPSCDGDLSWAPSVNVFTRLLADAGENPYLEKSLWWVHGANHDYFNSWWNETDIGAQYCDEGKSATAPLFTQQGGELGRSSEQLYAGIASFVPFMRQHLSPPWTYVYHRGFANPLVGLDPELLAQDVRVDREYIDSPSNQVVLVLDSFSPVDGSGLFQPFGIQNLTAQEVGVYQHDGEENRLEVTWEDSSSTPELELVFAQPGESVDLSDYVTLDFRVARTDSPLNTQDTVDFSVELIGQGAQSSDPIVVSSVVSVVGPFWMLMTHTARIRLKDFDFPLDKVRGVRFTFDQMATGQVLLDDVLFSKYGTGYLGYYPLPSDFGIAPNPWRPGPAPGNYTGNTRYLGTAVAYDENGQRVTVHELEVTSEAHVIDDDTEWEVALDIGDSTFFDRRACTASPARSCLVFRIERSAYAALEEGDPMRMYYYGRQNADTFALGSFSRAR